MRRTELRGREQESALLFQATDDARAGSGTTILLQGEAGIGKTRLIDELVARAESVGLRVWRGGAEELEQDRPFGALIEALGPPEVLTSSGAQAAGSEEARFVVQDAFVDRVEDLAVAPSLLVLDDLQWADRATLATVWALARRSRDMGLLLVAAFRPAPTPDGLQRVIEGCERLGSPHVVLGPIPDDALNDLAFDLLGEAPDPRLLEQLDRAGGNPFIAIELLSSLSSDGPTPEVDETAERTDSRLSPALRGALLRRFTGLSETAQQALPVAAVLGSGAGVDDLAALLEISSGEAAAVVAEATAAGLFDPAGEVIAFRHDLIREALYEELPASFRITWHREAARRLEGRAEPAVVARHLLLGAGRGDAETVRDLRRAATDLAKDTPDIAATLFERALELSRDPADRADLGLARAEALLGVGRPEEAERQADEVLAAPIATAECRARVQNARAQALTYQARFGEALAGYEQALAAGTLDEAATAAAIAQRALHCVFTGALDQALEAADQAAAEGRRLGVTVAVCNAQYARCLVHTFRSEFDVAIDAGREAVALAETDATVASNDSLLGMALAAGDQLDEAREVAEAGRRRATARGEVLTLPTLQMTLAFIEWGVGRWDAALAEVDAVTGLAEDFGVRVGDPVGHAVVGNVAFHRGDRAGAEAALRAGQAVNERGGLLPRNLLARLAALVTEADGDVAGAASVLFEGYELQRMLGIDSARNMLGVECARLAVAAGTIAMAEDLAADLTALAARADSPTTRGSALYARGVLEHDGAMLDAAAVEFAAGGRVMHRLRALESAGEAFVAADARDDAVASLQDARALTDQLGAAHDARRITASLRELGVRIGIKEQPTRPTHGWESLTNAERDVAELVVEGLRNGEIAERLFVSRRTVETHVSRLYQKLETTTRVELADAIREHLAV